MDLSRRQRHGFLPRRRHRHAARTGPWRNPAGRYRLCGGLHPRCGL
jgi:hypothetical protein